ncbi:MAG: hypothetical protein Q8P60_14800 [Pseudorhodobacter sp.]|nr:hypothetical protein [Pseudorhodobacter sp.]
MRHDWVFDVLKDLRSYALKNGLPLLAVQVEDTLRVARAEIAASDAEGDAGPQNGESHGGLPPGSRPH